MTRGERKSSLIVAVFASLLAAAASPALGVGLLQSFDLEIRQGSNVLFSAAGINTDATPLRDGSTAIHLGTATTGAHVWATVKIDKPDVADEPDRYFEIRLNGTFGDTWPGLADTLFNTGDNGSVEIGLTNMVFTGVDAINRVEPFHPDDYLSMPGLPFCYILNHGLGFLNLPGAIQYTPPNYPESVQVPKDVWTSEGYGFAKLPSGWNTGFELTDIPDLTAWDVTPIDPIPGPPYFLPVVPQVVPGWMDEVGICLNMRDVVIPEPGTALTIMALMVAPLTLGRRRRRS